ncbi:MAG: PQQ-binding-like beta-propeller repeat protein [Spirochaetales bacterium]|nr:PQQ-binding-like beta-propeller repeat protein [Spirochaetales bacterium]
MRITRLKIPACMFLMFSLAGALFGQDVDRFRGDGGDSFYTDRAFNPEALANGAKILWQAAVNQGFSAVALKDKRLYTMGNDRKNDTVWCLNEDTGEVVWRYTYPCRTNEHPGPRATPTIDGDVVYTVSLAGHLHALRADTGKVIWKRNLVDEFGARLASWALGSSVVIDGDMLLVNACTSGVALKKKTGAKIWASKGAASGYATPVLFTIGSKKYGAFFGADAIYGVDIATGRVAWRDGWFTSYDVNAADPLAFDNKLFISSGYGKGCALYEFTENKLTRKWSNRDLAAHFSSPVYMDGFIYGISGNSGGGARYVVLKADTGKVVRSEKARFGNFIVVNRRYFFTAFERGEITVAELTPSSYRVVSSAKLRPNIYWTAPVLSGGRAYIRNGRGDLFCIDMR